jgi:signal transduction histidine kinase
VIERTAQAEVAVSNLHAQTGLIDQAVAEKRGLADRAGVQLVVGDFEGVVVVDADRIVQVLNNLLSNSVKFSREGDQVRLSAATYGRQVRFSVTDRGRGIPADKLDSIFERFRQVDASDARLGGGTGLGLTICKNIVQQHSGRVWVDSTLGQGSSFYVELPSAVAPAVLAA